MASKLLLRTDAGHCHLPALLQLSACLCLALVLLPLSRAAATVVTHLPGFDGPLPFYLETGYVEVEEESGTELFYYFVESQRNPRTDPVLLWLAGGPRCSSFCGFVFGIGPLKFVLQPYDGTVPRLVYNPDSWTRVASILFLDSPVGSGFSYARSPSGYDIGDSSSSRQVVTFLTKWFEQHPWLTSNHFYVAGDSYAGKIVPLVTQYISEVPDLQDWLSNRKLMIQLLQQQSHRAGCSNIKKIKLTSIALGALSLWVTWFSLYFSRTCRALSCITLTTSCLSNTLALIK